MPTKGNNGLCGETEEPCIDEANFGQNGATFFEGQYCILRKTCLKRDQCAPCETDLDCSRLAGQRCINIGGSNRCARDCGVDGDCDDDYQCIQNSCVPRFGACEGTGLFCEPCQDDTDCGGPESHFACVTASGGQKACFDLTFPDTCTTDSDCPASPSGLHGECLDGTEGFTSTDELYHHCYFPSKLVDNIPKFGCW